MMKRTRFYFITMLVLVLFAACGQDDSQEVAYANINIKFAPSAPHQNVTSVFVFITIPDGDDIEKELDIDGRKATGAVAVPVGESITIRAEAYDFGEIVYTGSEEVFVSDTNEPFPVNIVLNSGGGIDNIDIVGLNNNQRVDQRTQLISGMVPESIAPNVDHARIHLINTQTEGNVETRLMNVGEDGSFSQAIVLTSGDNTIWVEFVDENNQVIGSTERITLGADIPVMDLKVILTWDSEADMDLHIIDPNEEEIYFFHMTSAIGGSLDIDDTNGYGPETFTLLNAIPGDYTVKVVAYWLGNDTANATVRVFIRDKPAGVFGPYKFNDTGELWEIPEKIRM